MEALSGRGGGGGLVARLAERWRRRVELRRFVAEPGLVGRVQEARLVQASLAPEVAGGLEPVLARADALLRRRGDAADAIWRCLHQVRHVLCEHGDAEQLIRVAADVRADLEGPAEHRHLVELELEVREIREGRVDPARRRGLLWLSVVAAEAREAAWRRSNRLMKRRRRASLWLLALALVLAAGAPCVVDGMLVKRSWESWLAAFGWLAVLGCGGAIGGLLSGLLRDDRVELSSIEHRLELFAFQMRPRIGAVAALLLALSAEAGIVQLPWSDGKKDAALVLAAIAAGFSERFLLGHIDRLVEATRGSGGAKGGGGAEGATREGG